MSGDSGISYDNCRKAPSLRKHRPTKKSACARVCAVGVGVEERDNFPKGGEADLAQVKFPGGEGGAQRGMKEAPELVK